jgi:hypothetical protein
MRKWKSMGFCVCSLDHNEFRPLHSNQVWWVAVDQAVNESYEAIASDRASILDARRPATVRIVGMLSPEGRHGYLDGYTRTFVVIEVLEIRRTTDADLQRFKHTSAPPAPPA